MTMQMPPENWPYGASFGEGGKSGELAPRAAQPMMPAAQPQPAPQSASAPFQSQFSAPIGGGAAAAQPLPYMYPAYTSTPPPTPPTAQQQTVPGMLPLPLVEQSYIENILRLNLGKTATVYCTFEGNSEWNAKAFTGTVEAAGRDHVIVKDAGSETRYLIPMVFVNYITFTGPMAYSYPYAPATPR
ncbi:MAG: spore coat protein GerQ [Sporolactobacillus sp.]